MCRRKCIYLSVGMNGHEATMQERICNYHLIAGVTKTRRLLDRLKAEGKSVTREEFSELMKTENCPFFASVRKKDRKVSLNLRQCEECGTVFTGTQRARYCPKCRENRRQKYQLEYQKEYRARKYTRICEDCGAAFTAGRTAKYCPACRSIRFSESWKERKERMTAGRAMAAEDPA